MNERQARLILMSILEPGTPIWTEEISSVGALGVCQKFSDRIYDTIKYAALYEKFNRSNFDALSEAVESARAQLLIPSDENWPQLVDELSAPPIGLLVKGNIDALAFDSLAIVGTRNPTSYGLRIAGDFAAGFTDRGWAVTSGGAYGIDTAAHKGALAAEGPTIAVIASGIDIEYPLGNSKLFSEIQENGAIVSESLPGVPALPHRFLTRNRLIAALSKSTLVVEAAFRSGSLRTARDAAELLRPVMAIPGPINSPSSDGCHRLIGERCAEIVTSVGDALELISAL